MKAARWTVILLAFAAPLVGGHVSLDASPASGGDWAAAAVLGGPEAPMGTRLLLFGLVLAGLVLAWRGRKVGLLPRVPWLLAAMLWLGASAGPALWTKYLWPHLTTFPSVVLFVLVVLLATGSLGRKEGPAAALDALVAGSAALACRGILEYAAVRAGEPGYRVFGGWNNPNALAAMLSLALPVAVVRAAATVRVHRLALGAAAVLVGLSLVLTQSKGGLLAAAAGLGTALALLAVSAHRSRLLPAALATVLVCGAVGAAALRSASASGGGAPSRVVASAGSAQSAGYRTLLWRGTLALALENPSGTGLGTYRFVSARPGLTPVTYASHQVWLQTAAESGLISLGALLAVFWFGVRAALGGLRHLPPDRHAAAVAATGALAAFAADGMVETNLAYLGVAVSAALAMGCGMAAGNDGVAPEPVSRKLRLGFLALAILPSAGLALLAALGEQAKSEALFHAAASQREASLAALGRAEAYGFGMDAEASGIRGRLADSLADLETAARLQPTARNYRAVASAQSARGEPLLAYATLQRALREDPNNLAALWQAVQAAEEAGLVGDALQTAQRLLAVEETPYFQVRAIPEIVPLETYHARVYLARSAGPEEAASLLKPAVEGYLAYLQTTLPIVLRMEAVRPGGSFLGESVARARDVHAQARSALEAYRRLRPDDPWAPTAAEALASVSFEPSK